MKFTTTITSLIVVLVASMLSVAAPIDHTKRDVWDPTIISPNASTVWTIGGTFNVTWQTDDAPVNISNGAAIFLRTDAGMLQPVLAQGFDLRSGSQEVTVPANFTPATNYRVVLFGDSGNWSPEFAITA
ncbi:hypothetical protein K488DRAFT_69425 [Vararia minispora EC-137]|uniref:Uncharacterized protein n=1 Tax=Vararia minispora EC-137 TaxID=1314806 RepID=A0ACB8QRG0_9AGAM|nr:hypothetical protein K488DRAFT_69425 [Vararia minispora EC-137]